jgi:hypothetical protein
MLRGRFSCQRTVGSFSLGLLLLIDSAACLASLSTSSFPCRPSWPGIHLIVTSKEGYLCASWCIDLLKVSAKYVPGHCDKHISAGRILNKFP